MEEQLIETWRINNRIDLYLLDSIDASLLPLAAPTKGRSVGEQLAHLHNVRLMWLKASSPDLLDGLEKIEKEGTNDPALLKSALTDSGAAIETLLRRGIEADGKIKGFKPHVTAFVGYMLAHDAHHRGQILMILKAAKVPVDKKVQYGIWEWGVR